MMQEPVQKQFLEDWTKEIGYTRASRRIENIAQMLMEVNPLFENSDFTNLKILDIGCGGMSHPGVKTEHSAFAFRLWEPWFLRIAWLLNATVRDGIDIVMQPPEDRDLYNHTEFNLYQGFSTGHELQYLLGTEEDAYNLINCTNVINPLNPSPYLDNLFKKLGIEDQKLDILNAMVDYVKTYAETVLEENGILALDDNFYVKREGKLVEIQH